MAALEFPRVSNEAREAFAETGLWNDQLLDLHIERVAAEDPDRVAVVDEGHRLTYAQLLDRLEEATAGLRNLGVGAGDVISFQLPNWWEALVVHHAAIRIGAVSNPLMPILRERELRFMLGQARSRVLIVPDEFRRFSFRGMAEQLQEELPDLEHVVVVRGDENAPNSFTGFLSSAEEPGARPGRSADDPILLLYTSGTESQPKGAVHTHNTLGYENRSIIEHFGLTGEDVMFMPSPVGHITGVLYGFHLAAMLGTKVAFLDIWEPAAGLRLIEAERCSFVVAATPFLQGMVEKLEGDEFEITSMRNFACGGADVPPELIRLGTELIGGCVARIYGSTEFPTLSSGRNEDPLDLRAETDGRVIGAAEARILDEAGALAPVGEVGDLEVRGPEMFLGYLDEERTKASIDAEGWFSTGDRARIDAGGYVEIVGRSKDIIIRGGENISAKEVEDLLFEHPDVAEVAVVAVPDPIMVERACAVVVPRGGAKVTLSQLTDHLLKANMAMQKLPERLELVDELPKTASGKVKKFELRERVAKRAAQEQSEG